jgi:hypothetical protein
VSDSVAGDTSAPTRAAAAKAKVLPAVAAVGGTVVYGERPHPAAGPDAVVNGEVPGGPALGSAYQDGGWRVGADRQRLGPVDRFQQESGKAVGPSGWNDDYVPTAAAATGTIASRVGPTPDPGRADTELSILFEVGLDTGGAGLSSTKTTALQFGRVAASEGGTLARAPSAAAGTP